MTNKHNVPDNLWSQWSAKAKEVYNGTMDQALPNEDKLTPFGGYFNKSEEWETICHNISCLAAWAVDGDVRTEIVEKEEQQSVPDEATMAQRKSNYLKFMGSNHGVHN